MKFGLKHYWKPTPLKMRKLGDSIERNNYYNGLGLGGIVTANSITPSIAYSTKNFIYLGGYDLQEKNIKLGLFYKFNFGK